MKETRAVVLVLVGVASNIVTFFFPGLRSSILRSIALYVAAFGFLWANFRVYRKLAEEVEALHKREAERARTRVNVAVELRRLEPNKPIEAFIRLDNASGSGVKVTRLVLKATVRDNKGEPHDVPQSLYIGPHDHRELESTALIQNTVWAAIPAGINVDGQHEADVEFTPCYEAEGISFSGPPVIYHFEFGGIHFQKATVVRSW